MPRHAERKLVLYRPDQLFDLVADVGRYPEFLPWCIGARIRSRSETELVADLTIGFGPFRESFTSRVTLDRAHDPMRISVSYENGPFRFLNNRWQFLPGPDGGGVAARHHGGAANSCLVDFFVEFEFRSRLLQSAIGLVFAEAVRRMVNAFTQRARVIYGSPVTTNQLLPQG